jgi:hypothetical protein
MINKHFVSRKSYLKKKHRKNNHDSIRNFIYLNVLAYKKTCFKLY